jgi:hypothetical protein
VVGQVRASGVFKLEKALDGIQAWFIERQDAMLASLS